MYENIQVDGNSLSLEQVVQISRFGKKAVLSPEAIEAIKASRETVEHLLKKGKVIYGINTGFGKFSDVAISEAELEQLQKNLIYSDAVGIGRCFEKDVTRAIMLMSINKLAKGFSGIRLETVNVLLDMLNKGVHPQIREKGSVGASGDLCPLAHMVMVMMGEGEAEYQGRIMEGEEAMRLAGIKPINLQSKEGLALINGTCAMLGVAALAVYDAMSLVKLADISAALTFEALEGIKDAFDSRIHKARPHKGQLDVAENMLRLIEGSYLVTRQGEKRVQDAYTLRCIPQVHGGTRPAVDYVKQVIEVEINSATDNPLVFPGEEEGEVLSGGNFHGQPVAIAMDTLGIAMAELANISERRIERLVNPVLSGLPAFLAPNGGLNCGFMVPQYAAAAVVSENKVLAHPASVDSIPTSANQEDHVSMGTIAARKAAVILEHVTAVFSVELLCGAQAADFRGAGKLGMGTKEAMRKVREKVTFMESDRPVYKDMDKVAAMIHSGEIVKAVEAVVGELK